MYLHPPSKFKIYNMTIWLNQVCSCYRLHTFQGSHGKIEIYRSTVPVAYREWRLNGVVLDEMIISCTSRFPWPISSKYAPKYCKMGNQFSTRKSNFFIGFFFSFKEQTFWNWGMGGRVSWMLVSVKLEQAMLYKWNKNDL